ncbi:hypothetical protein [Streptomyces sp. NPDC047070]|uniref:hypothetical protein n=1 Tax=Streptomyces sp. NPDC047070 TaxID=3154923 RepID=UPI003453CA3F
MSTSFGDDLLVIQPLISEPGIKLYGQVMGAHKIPLNLALLACRRQAKDITVDLTHVDYLSQSALETLVGTARTLPAPAHLTLRSHPDLHLAERLTDHGWHQTQSLKLTA